MPSIATGKKSYWTHTAQVDDVSGRRSLAGSFSNRVEKACDYLAGYHKKRTCNDITPSNLRDAVPTIAKEFNISERYLYRLFDIN